MIICVELSEYVPVATNWRFVPTTMLGVMGVIMTETSTGVVTTSRPVKFTPATFASLMVTDLFCGWHVYPDLVGVMI